MSKEKNLGLPTVVATGMGMIIATSCMLSVGQGASYIGTPFIIAMIVACAINILTAMSMAELNALMPNLTGGLAQYTHASCGSFVTIVTMVGGYIVCNTVVGSAETSMFGNTIVTVFPNAPFSGTVFSIGMIVLLIIVNLMGVDMFAKVQNVIAYVLMGSVFIMGIMGIVKVNPENVVTQPAVLDSSISGIGSMCGLAFFLFIGCEFIIPIANHVKNPRRNVPLGMILSLIVVGVMDAVMVLAFHNYVPWADLAESATPHILYGSLLAGKVGMYWMALVSLLAVMSTINSTISALAYIIFGMSKIQLLPRFMGLTNRRGAPVLGILLTTGIIIAINATGISTSEKVSFLILTGCVYWMIAYLMSHLNVIILRRRMPKAPRTFKVPGGLILPVIGFIGTAWMIWNIDPDFATKMHIFKVCGIIGIGLCTYSALWVKLVTKEKLFQPIPLEQVMAMEHNLYAQYHQKSTRLPDNVSEN